MITEKDLQEAIAECQGIRNPNANTCIKLASYYTILDHLETDEPSNEPVGYSYASYSQGNNVINYYSDTEFSKIVNSKETDSVMEVIDELMITLQVVNPRLYASVIRKLKGEG